MTRAWDGRREEGEGLQDAFQGAIGGGAVLCTESCSYLWLWTLQLSFVAAKDSWATANEVLAQPKSLLLSAEADPCFLSLDPVP